MVLDRLAPLAARRAFVRSFPSYTGGSMQFSVLHSACQIKADP
jgi:hypothetical protein